MSKHHANAKWAGDIVRKARAYWKAQIDAGIASGVPIACGRCSGPIEHNDQWDVGHVTALAEGGDMNHHWPEHSRCNRADGARMTNNRKRRMRAW